jgi:hypothetical protein
VWGANQTYVGTVRSYVDPAVAASAAAVATPTLAGAAGGVATSYPYHTREPQEGYEVVYTMDNLVKWCVGCLCVLCVYVHVGA